MTDQQNKPQLTEDQIASRAVPAIAFNSYTPSFFNDGGAHIAFGMNMDGRNNFYAAVVTHSDLLLVSLRDVLISRFPLDKYPGPPAQGN